MCNIRVEMRASRLMLRLWSRVAAESNERVANPYAKVSSLNHQWMALTCVGCLAAGLLAGRFVDIGEADLKPIDVSAIQKHARKTFEFRPDLAPACIRIVFVLAARRAGVMSNSIAESCATPQGLEEIAAVLQFSAFQGVSVEDVAVIMAIEAIRFLRGPYDKIVLRYGRLDGPAGTAQNLESPSFAQALNGIVPLSDAECVALMGAHSVGQYHEHVSGITDCYRSPRPYLLNTQYFKILLDSRGSMRSMPVPPTTENKGFAKLPSSMKYCNVRDQDGRTKKCVFTPFESEALLQEKSMLKWVEVFAKDASEWEHHFQAGFQKLIDSNCPRLVGVQTQK